MMNMKDIEVAVKKINELKEQRDKISSEIEVLEEDIKSHMNETQTYAFEGEDWKVTWNMVSQKRFNQSDFGKDYPDLLEKYKRLSESRRFLTN